MQILDGGNKSKDFLDKFKNKFTHTHQKKPLCFITFAVIFKISPYKNQFDIVVKSSGL